MGAFKVSGVTQLYWGGGEATNKGKRVYILQQTREGLL